MKRIGGGEWRGGRREREGRGEKRGEGRGEGRGENTYARELRSAHCPISATYMMQMLVVTIYMLFFSSHSSLFTSLLFPALYLLLSVVIPPLSLPLHLHPPCSILSLLLLSNPSYTHLIDELHPHIVVNEQPAYARHPSQLLHPVCVNVPTRSTISHPSLPPLASSCPLPPPPSSLSLFPPSSLSLFPPSPSPLPHTLAHSALWSRL